MTIYNSYIVPEAFQPCIARTTLCPGNNSECCDSQLCIDMDYFMHNRIYDIQNIDLIIEFYVLNHTMSPPPDFILAYFCKIVTEKDKGEIVTYNIKPMYSKCKVQNSDWYHLEDIFGLNSEDSMCEICCCEKKNTN